MAKGDNVAKVTFKAETQQFKENIQALNREMTELRAELRLNQAELQRDGQSVENLQGKLNNLTQQFQTNERILENLNKELQVAKNVFGEDSAEAQRLQTQITNLTTTQTRLETQINATNNELEELQNESRQASNGMEQLADAEEQAEDKTDEVSGGFDALSDALGDFIHDGIEKVVEAFGELMTESDDAFKKLQANTGATNKAMQDYQQVMKDIYYDNWGESFEEVGEAVALVRQNFSNLDKKEMTDVSKRLIMLSDVFDYDLRESMLSVKSLMKQYGLTSEEAFNLIVQGAQNGLNANDDLLDTVNEYAVQFRDGGYSAEQMFNMLNNGAQEGTWSIDKLGDAVKEMNIRMSDDTVFDALEKNKSEIGLTTEEIQKMRDEYMQGGQMAVKANQDVLDKIFSIEDANTRYQMGVQALGTMWEDLGEKTIRELYNVNGQFDKNKQSIKEVEDVMNSSLSAQLSSIGRQIKQNLIDPFVDMLLPIAKTVFGFINDHFNQLKPIIMAVGIAFGVLASYMAIQGIIGMVTKAFELLNITMMANPVMLVVGAIAVLITVLYQLYQSNEEFRNGVNALWETIKPIVTMIKDTIIEGIKSIWEALQSAWNEINGVISEVMSGASGIMDIIRPIAEFMGGFVVLQIKLLVETIKIVIEVIKWLVEAVIYLGAILVEIFQGAWEICKAVFDNICEAITTVIEFFTNLWDSIVSIWNGITDAISNAWETIKQTFMTVLNAIITYVKTQFEQFKAIVTTVFNTIKNTVTTIWNGIKNTISTVVNSISSTVSNVINNIKNFFSNGFNACKNTVTNVFSSIVNAIKEKLNTAKDFVKGVINTIKNFFNFNWSLPKIKLPHFKISGSKNPLDWIDKGVPKISVDWYAKGGIFTQPTIIPTLSGFKGVGERGQEAVLPIDKLQEYMINTVNTVLGNSLQTIIDRLGVLIEKDNNLYVDSNKLSESLGKSNDYTSSTRFNLNQRGLSI